MPDLEDRKQKVQWAERDTWQEVLELVELLLLLEGWTVLYRTSSSTHRLAQVPRRVGLLVVGQAEGGVELRVEHVVVHQAAGLWVETLGGQEGGVS